MAEPQAAKRARQRPGGAEVDWWAVPGVVAYVVGLAALFAVPLVGSAAGAAAATPLILVGCVAWLPAALGFPFRDVDTWQWLRRSVDDDLRGWRAAGWRDWVRTGLETPLALGLLARLGIHVLCGTVFMTRAEREAWSPSYDLGLVDEPVTGMPRHRLQGCRYMAFLAGVGLVGLLEFSAYPFVAKVVLAPQAMVLLVDGLVAALVDTGYVEVGRAEVAGDE